MDRRWVKIASWHAVDPDRVGRALCGRQYLAGSPERDVLGAEKSCESCLRKVARQEDAP